MVVMWGGGGGKERKQDLWGQGQDKSHANINVCYLNYVRRSTSKILSANSAGFHFGIRFLVSLNYWREVFCFEKLHNYYLEHPDEKFSLFHFPNRYASLPSQVEHICFIDVSPQQKTQVCSENFANSTCNLTIKIHHLMYVYLKSITQQQLAVKQ